MSGPGVTPRRRTRPVTGSSHRPRRRRPQSRRRHPVTDPAFELVLVTGMSGAGRSTAARALEDIGWFVIDNLPPELLPDAVEHISRAADVRRLAVVVDVRGGHMFDDLS